MSSQSQQSKLKKVNLLKRVYELASKHKQVVLVSLLNVGSNQVQQIKRKLEQNGATLIIGKNTVIKKAIMMRMTNLDDIKDFDDVDSLRQYGSEPITKLQALYDKCKGKIGYIFTDTPAFELKPIILSNRVKTDAKVGMIAQCDVTVPPGPTGLDPNQISFFHALQITTKIVKGQIEIVSEFRACKFGEPVTSAAAALLKKLNITPFTYGMELEGVYDDGSIIDPSVVSITPDDIIAKFTENVGNLTSMSLALNIPTQLSVPHMIANAFKNVAAVALETDYDLAILKTLQAAGPAVQQTAQTETKKEEVKQEEPEEEEEDVDMGDLFGDF